MVKSLMVTLWWLYWPFISNKANGSKSPSGDGPRMPDAVKKRLNSGTSAGRPARKPSPPLPRSHTIWYPPNSLFIRDCHGEEFQHQSCWLLSPWPDGTAATVDSGAVPRWLSGWQFAGFQSKTLRQGWLQAPVAFSPSPALGGWPDVQAVVLEIKVKPCHVCHGVQK